jgi:hypothetical protein
MNEKMDVSPVGTNFKMKKVTAEMFLRKSGCDFFSEADKNLDPDPAPDPAFCGQIRCKSFFSFFRFYIRQ